jgi:hypothetical protein
MRKIIVLSNMKKSDPIVTGWKNSVVIKKPGRYQKAQRFKRL